MVSPGILARPSVCLRCRLREVLSQARAKRRRIQPPLSIPDPRRNAFSTQSRRRQDAGEDLLVKGDRPYYWKKVRTPERVIGKPGRRQRVVSERLSRDSLERPANVIVFRDVAEEPEIQSLFHEGEANMEHELRPKALTAKEIEDAITGRYIAPAETEVNASIEALRPDLTVVEEQAFEEHKQSLLKAYTYSQLSRYLAWSFHASGTGKASREYSKIGDEVQELGITKWHAGQTPLQYRHSHVTERAGPNTKAKLVDQILRLAWHLTIQSEEQEIGELEVRLQPWQVTMLFDILRSDRPQYQSFVRSPILLKMTQVHLWRPHGVMRLTGRRQDVEEVARQLKLALLRVERLELDFKPFSKLLSRRGNQQKEQLFSGEELSYVSSLTKSVITIEKQDVLVVYGINEATRHNARRLLLSLLDLPTSTSFDSTSESVQTTDMPVSDKLKNILLPVDLSSGLHRRHHGKELLREVQPTHRNEMSPLETAPREDSPHLLRADASMSASFDENLGKISQALAGELVHVPPPKHHRFRSKANSDSYWYTRPMMTGWKVELGRLLRPTEFQFAKTGSDLSTGKSQALKKTTSNVRRESSIFQHLIPGLQTLLSYFESRPTREVKSEAKQQRNMNTDGPYLIAHFVPSPASRNHSSRSPRIQLRFKFFQLQPNAAPQLALTKMLAIVDEQHLNVPLTECPVDLRFSRRATLKGRLESAEKDQAIRDFIEKLRDSTRRQDGLLVAPPELAFRLPEWLGPKDARSTASQGDVEVKYLFERFEQVERAHYTPRQRILDKEVDEDVKSIVRNTPSDMILDYREVEGGAIYGSRTMLGLRADQTPMLKSMTSSSSSSSSSSRDPTPSATEQSDGKVTDSNHSPTLDTDTAAMSQSSSEPSEEQSQAGTTHHGGEHGQAAPEPAVDVQGVEQTAESSQDSNAKTRELVLTALRFSKLLNRAASGSLRHYGSQK